MSAPFGDVRQSHERPGSDGPESEYVLSRLRSLSLHGESALFGGNNVETWRRALALQFQKVEVAKDASGDRPQLPYPDASFDAVLFDGIGQATLSARMLAEFLRVLRPGGRAYFCLVADGLYRGLSDETSRRALYQAAWRRANDAGLSSVLRRFAGQQKLKRLAARSIAPLTLLSTIDAGRELLSRVRSLGGDSVAQLRSDVRQIFRGEEPFGASAALGAIQPDEFARFANVAGFTDFQWAVEGTLVTDWLVESPAPRHPGYRDGELAVWECLIARPAEVTPPVDPVSHVEAGRLAARQPLLVESSPRPVISNRSLDAFPQALLEFAKSKSARVGGDAYLRRLSAALIEGAASEDEVARRIVRFVQSAIFRDPISQPVNVDGSLPDAATILFCARGRCGHCSSLLVALAKAARLDARLTQLPRHVTCEMYVNGRWIIADADAFKHGVIPVNRSGELIGLDDLQADPFQLDRFPATGWYMRPGTRYTRAAGGSQVTGYVDACEPDRRGFISGYYVPRAIGCPPSLPVDLQWTRFPGHFRLEWSPSQVRGGRLIEYRVYVSSKSRGWTYDELGDEKPVATSLTGDVLSMRTAGCFVEGPVPPGCRNLFASVVAVSDRIDSEPETWFQPSEEAVLECQD